MKKAALLSVEWSCEGEKLMLVLLVSDKEISDAPEIVEKGAAELIISSKTGDLLLKNAQSSAIIQKQRMGMALLTRYFMQAKTPKILENEGLLTGELIKWTNLHSEKRLPTI